MSIGVDNPTSMWYNINRKEVINMDVNCYYCDYYDEEQDCCINGYFSDSECSECESEDEE